MKPLIAAAALAVLMFAPAAQSQQQPKSPALTFESLVRLDNPWGMTFLPDGRLLITEKPGRLRIFADGKLSRPVEGVPQVEYAGQGGLLDVEIDPRFSNNQLVYLSYAERAEQQPPNARDVPDPRLGPNFKPTGNVVKGAAVARGRLQGNQLKDVQVIWRQHPKTIGRGHFGGSLAFAPDGKLFITSGDRQRFEPAQDLATNLGKVVRINPDGSIPKDNPFAGKPGARPDIWTLGHRNPLGAAINPRTRQLWISEMGPKGGDEVNIVERGRNYGWPLVSNGDNYDDSPIPDHPTRPEFATPGFSWNPAISPSGLIFYTGTRFPTWRNSALIGGLSSQALIRLPVQGNKMTGEERLNMSKRVRDVIQGRDGAVLMLIDGADGELLRMTPADQARTKL